ncbi:MAG: hypothetical protein PHU98_06100 [Mariniphaga sp.]|nr:hypothetical protein [Mariniphaga sp.]
MKKVVIVNEIEFDINSVSIKEIIKEILFVGSYSDQIFTAIKQLEIISGSEILPEQTIILPLSRGLGEEIVFLIEE